MFCNLLRGLCSDFILFLMSELVNKKTIRILTLYEIITLWKLNRSSYKLHLKK